MATEGKPSPDLRSLEDVRREHLLLVLEACGWNRTRAAAILKVNRKTVYRMMERMGLAPPDPDD